jgi:Delta14-sterol reductase
MFDAILATLTAPALGRATLMLVGFVAVLFVLSKIVPGPRHEGAKLRDGTQRVYTLNGLWIWLLVAGGIAVATLVGGFSLAPVARHFWPLVVVANVFAFGATFLLYALARRKGLGRERSALSGLFYGAELNPTWWGVDLKMFSYKPSLIGLGVINASFAYLQYETHGTLSQPMLLFQAF